MSKRRDAAQREMAHRDDVGSITGCPRLQHGAFQSSVASLRPVDATAHEKDVMRGGNVVWKEKKAGVQPKALQ